MVSKKGKKKSFSVAEKNAFAAGRSYAKAKAGKRVVLSSRKERESFRNGVNSVRGRRGRK